MNADSGKHQLIEQLQQNALGLGLGSSILDLTPTINANGDTTRCLAGLLDIPGITTDSLRQVLLRTSR